MPKEYKCAINDFNCPYYDIITGTCHMEFNNPYCYPLYDCYYCFPYVDKN